MGLKGHTTRDIFADYKTHVYPPVSPAWFVPKAWGVADSWTRIASQLIHVGANFITKNVQVGDACYPLSPEPTDTTVTLVFSEQEIYLADHPTIDYLDVLYKVGHGPLHTIQSLASIYGLRAISYYTLHHGKLWTAAQIKDWNTDETGEVYVISHDTGKALWLDGELDLPAGFPGEPDRPPEPLPIASWELRFPDTPRPDYPGGLEPGGDLRVILIQEHGSLLAAHNSKKKIPK